MSRSKFLSDNTITELECGIRGICELHQDKKEYSQMYSECMNKLNNIISYTSFKELYDDIYSILGILSKAEPHYVKDKLNKCCKERDRYIYNEYGNEKDQWSVYIDSFGIESDFYTRECYWEYWNELERVIRGVTMNLDRFSNNFNRPNGGTILELVKEILDTDFDYKYFGTIVFESVHDEEDNGDMFYYDLNLNKVYDDDVQFEVKLSEDTIQYIKAKSKLFIDELYPKYAEYESNKESKEYLDVTNEIIKICKEIKTRFDNEFYNKYKEEYWDKIFTPEYESAYMYYGWDEHLEINEDMSCMKLCDLFAIVGNELENETKKV